LRTRQAGTLGSFLKYWRRPWAPSSFTLFTSALTSMGVPFSSVRSCPSPSKCSSARPRGSLPRWHPAKDWILLNAANAHVARCLIAIAKSRDLSVAGIVRQAELVAEIKELDVDFVGVESPELPEQIRVATSATPIRLGLDTVGGSATATITSVLSPGAHLVSYSWLSGLPIHLPQGDLIGKRLNIHGFWMYYDEYLPKIRAALTAATKVVASGKLTLPISATYKPSQIKEAIEHAQRGGKVLLEFNHYN
jgi:NADPH:quinone reductase-like Zn-dependent oxidoreductase